jgi:MHS family citrate/tricarballylate:H+ symporter-like MFS transporter
LAPLSSTERKHLIWSVVRVSSGNFKEVYDFFVFGYYASAIGKAFFPTGSEFAQLMMGATRLLKPAFRRL